MTNKHKVKIMMCFNNYISFVTYLNGINKMANFYSHAISQKRPVLTLLTSTNRYDIDFNCIDSEIIKIQYSGNSHVIQYVNLNDQT